MVNMLEDKQTVSLKRAVFIYENAYYGGTSNR